MVFFFVVALAAAALLLCSLGSRHRHHHHHYSVYQCHDCDCGRTVINTAIYYYGSVSITLMQATGFPIGKKGKYYVEALTSPYSNHFEPYERSSCAKKHKNGNYVVWNYDGNTHEHRNAHSHLGPLPLSRRATTTGPSPPKIGLILFKKKFFGDVAVGEAVIEFVQLIPNMPPPPPASTTNHTLFLDMSKPLTTRQQLPLTRIGNSDLITLDVMIEFRPQTRGPYVTRMVRSASDLGIYSGANVYEI